MIQATPTPLPNQGEGFGLLILFGYLYLLVALLAAGTVVAVALDRLRGRVPRPLSYLQVTLLVGALLVAGFAFLVALTSGTYEVVGFLLLVVFAPLSLAAVRARRVTDRPLEVVAAAAMAWCGPFLLALGGFFVVATHGESPVLVLGGVAAVLVVVGTVLAADWLAPRLFRDPSSGAGGG